VDNSKNISGRLFGAWYRVTETRKVYFEFDSRILTQLGEKLVPNKAVALAELVKNSYDADATKVIIKGRNLRQRGGKITLEDNGLGIQEPKFQETWMRVATLDKDENPFSKKYNRQRAGEKGIGRFACRRLSSKLRLISISETIDGDKEKIDVTFNWNEFLPGSDADKVGSNLTKENVDKDTPTGTTLILEGVYDAWDGRNILKLKNELSELFAPASFRNSVDEHDPGFNVDFDIPEFPGGVVSTDKQFFNSAWAKVTGYVNEDGIATYEIKVLNKILDNIHKKFQKSDPFIHIKNITVEAYVFSYRADLFKNSEWKMDKIRKLNAEKGGIKVYADQFRVFGYGGEGDDWLSLNYDRSRSIVTLDKEVSKYSNDERPGLRLFRNQNIFGHVIFARADNPNLEITINRDRLLENDSFEELRQFARLGIDFATVFYSNEISKEQDIKEIYKKQMEEEQRRKEEEERKRREEETRRIEEEKKQAEERARKAEEERRIAEERARKAEEERLAAEEKRRKAEEEAFKALVKSYRDTISGALEEEREARKREEEERQKEREARKREEEEKRKVEEERLAAEEKRRKAEEEERRIEKEKLRKEKEKIELEKSQLRVLASTGTLVLILEHEMQGLINDMEAMIHNFSSIIQSLPETKKGIYQKDLESFSNRTEMVQEFGKFLGLTVVGKSKLEKKEWVLYPIVEKVYKPFKWYFKNKGINFDNDVPDYIRMPSMYGSELVSILHNLMSNSLKAVKGTQDRRIKITAFEDEATLNIHFLDSGRGLAEEYWEEVFQPFVSYSEPDMRFGSGTGLGLKLVKDFIESYDGIIHFIKPPDNWNTCIAISFPLEE
jgi:signal transduction histidine kinase